MKRILLIFGWVLNAFAYQNETITPDEALNRLLEGNQRYMTDSLLHPNRTQERRGASRSKQTPFAIIVGCSDSRTSPEIIFDEGVGDLFVVRVAGNVIGPLEIDSVDYASLYLGSILIVVLGHEACGAVKAVINGTTKDIEAVAELIQPAVKVAKKEGMANLARRAIEENARRMKQLLLNSPVVGRLVQEGKMKVVAAYYNLNSGSVEILK